MVRTLLVEETGLEVDRVAGVDENVLRDLEDEEVFVNDETWVDDEADVVEMPLDEIGFVEDAPLVVDFVVEAEVAPWEEDETVVPSEDRGFELKSEGLEVVTTLKKSKYQFRNSQKNVKIF